jgi:hypothetical protein
MMDRERLIGYIQQPDRLSQASSTDFQVLINEYPYCQTAQLLYAKALFEQKDPAYRSQLKKAAAYLPDRSILYYLIHGAMVSSTQKGNPALMRNTRTGLTDTAPQRQLIVTQNDLDGLTLRLKRLAEVVLPDASEMLMKIEHVRALHEKRVKAIVAEYLEIRVNTQTAYDEAREIAEKEALALAVEEAQKQEALLKEAQVIEERAVVEQMHQEEPLTETVDLQEQEDLPAVEEAVPSAEVQDSPEEELRKQELIDRFIESNPTMPRPRQDFFSPVNMAHLSTLDKEDIVSETLAEVHLEQGYIQKALKIYQRLCLIIPEKSAYFAARIEKIKKDNNLL